MKLAHWTPLEISKKIGRRVGYYKYENAKKQEGKKDAVFLWIPKTAGTSIYKTLENNGFLKLLTKESVKFYFPQKGGVTFGHMNYSDLIEQQYVKKDFDKNAFKFSFVRNPYDRAVSVYEYYKLLNRFEYPISFTEFSEFLKKAEYQKLGLFNDGYFSHANKQTSYIYNAEGESNADFVGKVENIKEDFKLICSELGINQNLYHINKSTRKNLIYYYDRQSVIDNIYSAYEEDFDHFKYPRTIQ